METIIVHNSVSYLVHSNDSIKMYCLLSYLKLAANRYLSFSQQWSDSSRQKNGEPLDMKRMNTSSWQTFIDYGWDPIDNYISTILELNLHLWRSWRHYILLNGAQNISVHLFLEIGKFLELDWLGASLVKIFYSIYTSHCPVQFNKIKFTFIWKSYEILSKGGGAPLLLIFIVGPGNFFPLDLACTEQCRSFKNSFLWPVLPLLLHLQLITICWEDFHLQVFISRYSNGNTGTMIVFGKETFLATCPCWGHLHSRTGHF